MQIVWTSDAYLPESERLGRLLIRQVKNFQFDMEQRGLLERVMGTRGGIEMKDLVES